MPPLSHRITLDNSALSHAVHPLDWADGSFPPGTHEITLVPGSYSLLAAPRLVADFTFTLEADGSLVVDPHFAGFAQVSGNTLTIEGYRITLDTSALSHSLLPLLFGWAAQLPPGIYQMTLLPAKGYHFIPAPSLFADFTLTLEADGSLIVDPRFAGFAQANGSTLTITGYPITLDTDSLSHSVLPFLSGWSEHLPPGTHQMTLLPAKGYQFMPAPSLFADFTLALEADGSLAVDPRFAGFAQANGSTLTITGYRITLDTNSLSHSVLPFLSGWSEHLPPGTHQMTLLPAKGYQFMPAPSLFADFTLALEADGSLVVDPRFAGFAQANGSTLTITGYRITLDTNSLSHSVLPFLSGWSEHLPPGTHQMTLLPAKGYQFMPAPSLFADFTLALEADGSLVVDPRFAGFAQANGSTLTITGYPITLDTNSLSHSVLPFLSGWSEHLPPGTHQMTLLPAKGYQFMPAPSLFADFTLALEADGSLVVDPRFAGFAQANGSTLTITGYRITLDTNSLSHSVLPFLSGWSEHLPPGTHQMTLLPAKGYQFMPAPSLFADFTLALEADGSLVVDPRFAGFAQANGSTLTITGYPITLDTNSLSHSVLPFLSGWSEHLPGGSHELTLIPAAGYGFRLATGIVVDFQFELDVDGQVIFQPEFAGFANASANHLTIRGYPIILDATHADSDLLGIAGLEVRSQTPRELEAVMVPAKGYLPETANGICTTGFSIEPDGRIAFDPAAAGSYVIRNSSQPNPSEIGDEVSVRIYVRPAQPSGTIPQGIVTFKLGAELLGDATLDLNGEADFRTSELPRGEHEIVIDYLGNPDFRSSSITVRHRVE